MSESVAGSRVVTWISCDCSNYGTGSSSSCVSRSRWILLVVSVVVSVVSAAGFTAETEELREPPSVWRGFFY